jgi:hypothetical protein
MKIRIASILATAVAAVALPVVVPAQNPIADPASPEHLGPITAEPGAAEKGTSGAIVNSARKSNTDTISENIAGQTVNSSGIIQDGAAYIVHRLQSELTLPGGTKVKPDGQVIQQDGSKKELRPGQMMSLDGKVKSPAPFSASETNQPEQNNAPPAPAPGLSAPSTPSPSAGPFPSEFEDDLNIPPDAAQEKGAPPPTPESATPQGKEPSDDFPD